MSDGEFQIPEEIKEARKHFENAELVYSSGWEELKTKPMTGIEKIAQERLEQKVKHGRSVKHDAENNSNFELANAAMALISHDVNFFSQEWDQTICNYMLRKTYEERLVIAGALIAAEIDRLNFKE